jgi:hypothetical protein
MEKSRVKVENLVGSNHHTVGFVVFSVWWRDFWCRRQKSTMQPVAAGMEKRVVVALSSPPP